MTETATPRHSNTCRTRLDVSCQKELELLASGVCFGSKTEVSGDARHVSYWGISGSKSEKSRHRCADVSCWGQSGSLFETPRLPFVAKSGSYRVILAGWICISRREFFGGLQGIFEDALFRGAALYRGR